MTTIQKPWSPPKPSYNSPKPSSSTMQSSSHYYVNRDPYVLSMERLQNWTFERSSLFVEESRMIEKLSIHCSPKSSHASLAPMYDHHQEDEDDFSSSTSLASLSNNENCSSIFEGWNDETRSVEGDHHERKLSDRTQQLIESNKKWAKSISSKKLFSMSNRTMADMFQKEDCQRRNQSKDSLFEELVEESFPQPPSSIPRRRSSINSFTDSTFLPSSYGSNKCEISCKASSDLSHRRCSSEEDSGKLFGLGLKGAEMPIVKTSTITTLSFDPLRRPRKPFPDCSPQKQSTVIEGKEIPKKAARLLGTFQFQSPPSPLKTIKPQTNYNSLNLSPCPDRMNGVSAILRPKPELPLKSPIRPPMRPARPTEEDIFADMIPSQVCYEKPVRRKIPSKQFPAPNCPLPKVPKKSIERSKQRPQILPQISTKEWKSNQTNQYAAYSKFEANLIEFQGEGLDKELVQVQLEVGGMHFASTLKTLCPKDVSVSQYGLCAWLDEQVEWIEKQGEEEKIKTRTRRFSSSCSSYYSDDELSHGISTVENSPSVRTPSLYEYSSLPLQQTPFQQQQQKKENVFIHREDHKHIPKSVSCESQLSVPEQRLYDFQKSQRNTFGGKGELFQPMKNRRSSSCSDLHSQHHSQDHDGDDQTSRYSFASSNYDQTSYQSQFDSILGRKSACLTPTESTTVNKNKEQIDIPTFVFAPSSNVKTPITKNNNKKVNTVLTSPTNTNTQQLFIALPANRNPICYQIILHLLQFGQLPKYFSNSSSSTYQQKLLLEEVRQECFWLGYSHLVNLCT